MNRSISCQYEDGEKKLRLTTPKMQNSYRQIPFFGEAEEMLRSQQKKVKTLKETLGRRWRTTGEYENLVFVTTMGSPVLRHHAEKEIKKVLERINGAEEFEAARENREPHYFKDFYPHAIRHTFCSRCFEVDMQPKLVQMLMGHQHYSTTIDIYTHVSEERYKKEMAKFGTAKQMKTEIPLEEEPISGMIQGMQRM